MNNIKNHIETLENMRTDLYQIISDVAAMNEAYKASQNDNRSYLWCGEFYEMTEYGVCEYCELKLYVIAKTEEEAEARLKARADEEYDDYEFYISQVEEDDNGIIEID